MSVHDAKPSDIYVDKLGKLWRVVGVCSEPTVTVEEVEGKLSDPSAPFRNLAGGIGLVGGASPSASIQKIQRSGGTGGLMWEGWKRIYRQEDSAC